MGVFPTQRRRRGVGMTLPGAGAGNRFGLPLEREGRRGLALLPEMEGTCRFVHFLDVEWTYRLGSLVELEWRCAAASDVACRGMDMAPSWSGYVGMIPPGHTTSSTRRAASGSGYLWRRGHDPLSK